MEILFVYLKQNCAYSTTKMDDVIEMLENCYKRIETVFLFPAIIKYFKLNDDYELKTGNQTSLFEILQKKFVNNGISSLNVENTSEDEIVKQIKLIDNISSWCDKENPVLEAELPGKCTEFLSLLETCIKLLRENSIDLHSDTFTTSPSKIEYQRTIKRLLEDQMEQNDRLAKLRHQDQAAQDDFEEKLKNLQLSSDQNIMQIITDSKYQMKKYHEEGEQNMDFLRKQLESKKKEYADYVQKTITEQKLTQKNISNLQCQLESAVKKFDTNIQIEYRKFEDYTDQVKKQKETYQNLLNKFNEQTELFNEAIEFELKGKEEREKKLAAFIRNRSAKIIQKAYKRSRSKMKKKKKGSKVAKGSKVTKSPKSKTSSKQKAPIKK